MEIFILIDGNPNIPTSLKRIKPVTRKYRIQYLTSSFWGKSVRFHLETLSPNELQFLLRNASPVLAIRDNRDGKPAFLEILLSKPNVLIFTIGILEQLGFSELDAVP